MVTAEVVVVERGEPSYLLLQRSSRRAVMDSRCLGRDDREKGASMMGPLLRGHGKKGAARGFSTGVRVGRGLPRLSPS